MYSKEVEKILLKVQKPGRYTGGELNSVIKDKADIDVRFAFCFPDTYEIGMSHLGMKILYSQFNSVDYIWCERVFAPWIDMEQQMRERSIPLYALESGDPLTEFDFIGFTLQYELSYTNVLNMLSLAGIPILSSERTELNNIVCAGGSCTSNPEPLADFIDLFFIGEGEEVDLEVIELYRRCKADKLSKKDFLIQASHIPGVYVPSLYTAEYNHDGTLQSFTPNNGAPAKVTKRIMNDLDNTFYPESFVVPMIEIVHDRAVEELFRGCIRGCRFCQAGFITRPVREKSIQTISRQCMSLCETTGYDEISLSSLSSSDYSRIVPLLTELTSWADKENISMSLPSLRVDGFTDEIMSKVKTVRKSGLTFAPEAGTQRLRDAINKNVTEPELLSTCHIAFSGGWSKVKLYFMIGLPTEMDEDVLGIVKLGQAVVGEFYKCEDRAKGRGVNVTVSASAFVPKPMTPFQWEGQASVESVCSKQRLIKEAINTKKITFNYHDAQTAYLEGVFARGDRRLCAVLKRAAERGFHFDGWGDCFSFDKWLGLFAECGIDPDFYTVRKRSFDELLPWDFLDYGVSKSYLKKECDKAYQSQTTDNCRDKCSACGAAKFKGGICVEKCKDMVH